MTQWSILEVLGSKPVELVTFAAGTEAFHYTSSKGARTVAGIEYLPGILERGSVRVSEEDGPLVSVKLDTRLPVVNLFRGRPRPLPIYVSIRREHASATDGPTRPALSGFVQGAVFRGAEVEVTIATHRSAAAKMPVPRISHGRECPHVVYDEGCRADPDASVDGISHTQLAEVLSVSGEIITLGGDLITAIDAWLVAKPAGLRHADEWLAGGEITTPDGTPLFVYAADEYDAGVSIRAYVIGPVPSDVVVSSEVLCLQGCRRTLYACHNDFANIRHFKGFPLVPAKDPFREGVR